MVALPWLASIQTDGKAVAALCVVGIRLIKV
jgi:hypothetical protein